MRRVSFAPHIWRRYASNYHVPGWETVIGLEVHAQLKSQAKLFSGPFSGGLDDAPNTRVSPFDAAFPGTLPIVNVQCVESAVRMALALGASVQQKSTFDRKHYFYPDLPAGYQITQKYAPIALGGFLALHKSERRVRIKQLQLEQDTGKSRSEAESSYHAIDLNRAGNALVEIVSEPDMRSAEEAADYVRTLQALIRNLGVGDAQMEDGSFRCDANISVHREGQTFGTRCEIKNLNSVKSLVVAISTEVARHVETLLAGSAVMQETRGFDEMRTQTYPLRSKEDAPDYRYLPDANLPPLLIDQGFLEHMRQTMPELPDAIEARLQRQYSLSQLTAKALAGSSTGYSINGTDVQYFERAAQYGHPTSVANWLVNELRPLLQSDFASSSISPERIGLLAELVHSGEITYASGRTVLHDMVQHPSDERPADVVARLGLQKVSNASHLEELCKRCLEELPAEVEKYRTGNERVLNKMVGYVRRLSQGTAEPAAITNMLRSLLANEK
ncbi:Glutamyl-tRNA amidotransferase subunit B, mitochondrial [Exidia glandulosa HHB12029]|uniref:Glutamyl-tRNA(Gln) amidotransferase subunit B, mitochondrial n=1 Tax=Exidia glandulosa HHB12029 TaxID=1314781 RepID=A0A165QVT5_EXIGL|nr:Glutamyl-tRNA amidotransferase subunit B, mitochondrial [Exidia glandulosa HHB12029]